MRRIILVLCVIVINSFICNVVYSGTDKIQYNSYEWGMQKNEAIQMIKRKDHRFKSATDFDFHNMVFFEEKYYGNYEEISLFFTPISNKLYGVALVISGANKIEEEKNTIEEKYGKLERVDKNKFIVKKNNRKVELEIKEKYNKTYLDIKYKSNKYKELQKLEMEKIKN